MYPRDATDRINRAEARDRKRAELAQRIREAAGRLDAVDPERLAKRFMVRVSSVRVVLRAAHYSEGPDGLWRAER